MSEQFWYYVVTLAAVVTVLVAMFASAAVQGDKASKGGKG